jgi:probable HAF family extracellular repeat protein
LYLGNGLVDLGTMGGVYSYANAINENDQLTGYADTPSGETHAFVYSGNAFIDLGVLPSGNYSLGRAINSHADVTGWSGTISAAASALHAFLYSSGSFKDLGTLGGGTSYGLGINAQRQVVGQSELADGSIHAFAYTDGAMYDLNSLADTIPPVVFTTAGGINDSGQIVADGCSLIKCQAYRLDPFPNPPAGGGGGGGCAMVQGLPGGRIDPTLPLMVSLAALWALNRKRKARNTLYVAEGYGPAAIMMCAFTR